MAKERENLLILEIGGGHFKTSLTSKLWKELELTWICLHLPCPALQFWSRD